jgi:hypothetical protein
VVVVVVVQRTAAVQVASPMVVQAVLEEAVKAVIPAILMCQPELLI